MTEKLQSREGGGRQSYLGTSRIPARSELLSFFDDGEDTAAQQSTRSSRRRPGSGDAPTKRPRPRRPQRSGRPLPLDQHTLMVRRRVAAGVGGRAADRDRPVRERLREKRTDAGAEELQPQREHDRHRIRRTGLRPALHHAHRCLGQVRAERRGAGRSAADHRPRASPIARRASACPAKWRAPSATSRS